jgi:sulfur-carrier protein adenylyltransferase/sulfurtransferase
MINEKKLFTPVRSMESDAAKQYMAEHKEGSYTLLDVRQPQEYEQDHISGAKLISLPVLGDEVHQLDPDKPIIIYCAIGGRSRAAAQLLSGAGFREVYNISGGIQAWNGVTARGPVELNMELVRGDETPLEIIRLAYAMEMALERFYTILNSRTKDPQLSDFYSKMVGAEQGHKKSLLRLLKEFDPEAQDVEAFEADIQSQTMEGGFDAVSFLEENEPHLKTIPDALSLALMLESQALDLYLRFSDRVSDSLSKNVLYKIADEEKSHLSVVAKMLEKHIQ